jgi:hypothetical protein
MSDIAVDINQAHDFDAIVVGAGSEGLCPHGAPRKPGWSARSARGAGPGTWSRNRRLSRDSESVTVGRKMSLALGEGCPPARAGGTPSWGTSRHGCGLAPGSAAINITDEPEYLLNGSYRLTGY